MPTTIPGEEFTFDMPYFTNKIGELSVLLEREQRKRMILFGAYMELKNKYEPEKPTTVEAPPPQVVLDIKDSKPVEEVHYGTEPPGEVPEKPVGTQFGNRSTGTKRKPRK